MAGIAVTRRRDNQSRTKVKTGCLTCRIRKIKCDEAKPCCQKCLKTGRICDGYESPFRLSTSQSMKKYHSDVFNSNTCVRPLRRLSIEVTLEHVGLLNHYFSTKTMFNVNLGCDTEAGQVLEASLTNTPIQHAILSLIALRADLEISGDRPTTTIQRTTGHQYGLQQYNMALGSLASNLSSPSSDAVRSALFCCQIFISIEQVRKNYAAMVRHTIQGLRIMHEHQARPYIAATHKLVPAHHDQLPLVDVFIIKLFIAPCKFAEPSVTTAGSKTTVSGDSLSSSQQTARPQDLRRITPNMQSRLKAIATTTLAFLDKVSHVTLEDVASKLLSEKAMLLDDLDQWLSDVDLLGQKFGSSDSDSVMMSFLRLFHRILKIVLLSALEPSSGLHDELQFECDQLEGIADSLGERLKSYEMCGRNKHIQRQRSFAS